MPGLIFRHSATTNETFLTQESKEMSKKEEESEEVVIAVYASNPNLLKKALRVTESALRDELDVPYKVRFCVVKLELKRNQVH